MPRHAAPSPPIVHQCLAKLHALDHYAPSNGAGTVLMYGDRTGANGIYTDATAAQVPVKGVSSRERGGERCP